MTIKTKPAAKAKDDLAIPAFLVRKPGSKPAAVKKAAAVKAPTAPTPAVVLTAEQLAAVAAFAGKYATRKGGWKEHLLSCWMNGADANEPNGHLLRQVRNSVGPKWLKDFELPKAPVVAPAPVAPAKPLTAKQLAQQAGGVKVTGTEAAKPAVDRGAVVKAPKAAKPKVSPAEMLKVVKAHAKKFAHQNGWDLIIANWSDEQITAEIATETAKRKAIAKMRDIAKALDKKRPAKAKA
jgi:hypothetical protein